MGGSNWVAHQPMTTSIPTMFFYNGELHRKRLIIRAEQELRAWSYPEARYVAFPLSHIKKTYKKAYTLSQAAALIRISTARVKSIIDKGLIQPPHQAYEFLNGSFKPLAQYISEDDMLELRQAAYDVLPKNRFGEPYVDTMASEPELLFRMKSGDDREFHMRDDGTVIKIYNTH